MEDTKLKSTKLIKFKDKNPVERVDKKNNIKTLIKYTDSSARERERDRDKKGVKVTNKNNKRHCVLQYTIDKSQLNLGNVN